MIPVVAGDSFEAQITSVINMSPLRRQLTIDARFDIFGFFVNHRHIYGDDWNSLVEGGYDESTTLTGQALSNTCYFYGSGHDFSGTVPKWIPWGYNRIWNRWFRVPNDTGSELADTYTPTGDDECRYGYKTAYLPSYLTGSDTQPASADYEYTLTASNLSLIDLEKLKARYKTELDRAWFTERYSEILKRNFTGSLINADAEQRPELCYRKTLWLSGHDVSGTDEGSLGAHVGRSQGVVQANMPRKFFKEHGTFWILCTLRYPTIVPEHTHYLATKADPSYNEISGDPRIFASEPPFGLEAQDINSNSADASVITYMPYGQWYRTHPSHVHKDLEDLKGFPFITDAQILNDENYIESSDYDSAFANLAMGHYQVYSKCAVMAQRVVPPAISSIYAGT